jgi:hypothetical protein
MSNSYSLTVGPASRSPIFFYLSTSHVSLTQNGETQKHTHTHTLTTEGKQWLCHMHLSPWYHIKNTLLLCPLASSLTQCKLYIQVQTPDSMQPLVPQLTHDENNSCGHLESRHDPHMTRPSTMHALRPILLLVTTQTCSSSQTELTSLLTRLTEHGQLVHLVRLATRLQPLHISPALFPSQTCSAYASHVQPHVFLRQLTSLA